MAKHKYIETPERMWDLFCAYRDKVKSTPIQRSEQRKGTVVLPKNFDGEMPEPLIELPLEKPLTLEGFENYVEDEGIISDLGRYFSNEKGAYDNYRTICQRIRRVIRQDQIEGGMAGIYNPSITQRLNGLTDKQEMNQVGKIQVEYVNPNNPAIPPSQEPAEGH